MRQRMSGRFGALVLGLSMALVGVLSTSVIAGTAGAADSVAKNDPGIGSAAALANPNCDQETKRVKLQSYSAPLCVKPWKDGADNGGATAQGVTADTIKVAVLIGDPSASELAARKGLYTNQATGENSVTAPEDSTRDINEIYKYAYETWGRTVEFTFVKTSGGDEAAQRADAVEVAALKPFAVLDEASSINSPPVGGGAVFQQALENAGVPLVISTGANDPQALSRVVLAADRRVHRQAAQGRQGGARRREHAGPAPQVRGDLPEQLRHRLLQGPAQEVRGDPRVGGVVHRAPGEVSLQTSSAEIDQQIPPLITKLKSAGVNNLIMMASHGVTATVTKAMKAQDWFPEITAAAFPYTDLDVLARTFDQEVWAHAFGLIWFLPGVAGRHPHAERRDVPVVLGHRQGNELGRRERAPRRALHRHPVRRAQARRADNRRRLGDRLRKANSGVGGAYSDSAFTFEASPPPPEGGIPSEARRWAGGTPTRREPATSTSASTARASTNTSTTGSDTSPARSPRRRRSSSTPTNSTSVFPAPAGIRTQVAHLSLRELPEHRQRRDHPRRRAGLTMAG